MSTHNFEGVHICKSLRLFWLENLVKRGRQYNWQNILYIGPLRIFHVVEDMIYILYVISIDEKLGWSPPKNVWDWMVAIKILIVCSTFFLVFK